MVQASDQILLTYKDSVTIRQADINTLNDGCWLNDAVISLYLDYLVDDNLANFPLADKALALEPAAAKLMTLTNDDEDLIDMLGPLRLEEKYLILCPLNDAQSSSGGGSHWAMLFVVRHDLDDPGSVSAYLMDSSAGSPMLGIA